MISNLVSSILNPAATAAAADKASAQSAEKDANRPAIATALAVGPVSTQLDRLSVQQVSESERADYFNSAKHMVQNAFKAFDHDIRDTFDALGFGDGIAGKMTQEVMKQTKNALLWGVGFSVKLMTATVSQTTTVGAGGTASTFSISARSVEIKINHSDGVIDIETDKVKIESYNSGGPPKPQPRLLDMRDTDAVPRGLGAALQALEDLKSIFDDGADPAAGIVPVRDQDVLFDGVLPVIETPRVMTRPEYSTRIIVTDIKQYLNERDEPITYLRFNAILPLSEKPDAAHDASAT